MNDFSRLEQKLAKLRQRERAPGDKRVIREAPEKLLSAILVEIDETILPRRLTFASSDNVSIHLAVANRRLQALVAPAPATEGAAVLAGVALADVEDENTLKLKDVILRSLQDVDFVDVSSRKQDIGGFPSDIGVPCGQLRRAWNIDEAGAKVPAEQLAKFLEAFGGKANAWIRIEGEDVVAQAGGQSELAGLSEHAAVFLDGYFASRDVLYQGEDGPKALLVSGGAGQVATVFLDSKDAMALLSSSTETAVEIVGNWQDKFSD
ncbi:MAG: hypothetical protein GKR98_09075 [Boseongicola sp.]|nr:MAG: hypothetical protein GKR98_09075 [Boseongicola sp.]